jgi:hypothetical protein
VRGDSPRRRSISQARPAESSFPGSLFACSAAGALLLHAALLFATGPLAGGADLLPHLALMEGWADEPGLRSTYAPAYHAAGALLSRVIPLQMAVKLLSLGAAAALLFGFRAFQRASGLPDASAALFCWAPYGFALSWCLPKVEAAGYGLAFAGLAWAWRKRRAAVAAALAGCFLVHTGAALFLGLCGGVLALQRRDGRLLAALTAGCLLAAPLVATHLAAGCSLAEALLFSEGDYLRRAGAWTSFSLGWRLPVLAGPVALALAAAGARALWREHRSVSVVALVVAVLCTNELWLAPLGVGSTLNLLRGLTILAFPLAAAAGVWVAAQPARTGVAVVAAAALVAVASGAVALPGSCHRVPVDAERLAALEIDRCTFRWSFGPRP